MKRGVRGAYKGEQPVISEQQAFDIHACGRCPGPDVSGISGCFANGWAEMLVQLVRNPMILGVISVPTR